MLTINQLSPIPIIDIGATKGTRSDSPEYSAFENPLNVLLDTANLGSNDEAFVCNRVTSSLSMAYASNNEQISFGVLLKPLQSVMSVEHPIFLDISMRARGITDAYQGKDFNFCPFVGFINSGLSPTDGWDATNNLVTNWIPLQDSQGNDSLNVNTQILLKDVVSANLAQDQYVCVGFTISSHDAAGSLAQLNYHISARYAFKPLTVYEEV